MATTVQESTPLNGYVGFDTITQQIEKKSLKRGFQFNIMVVGQTGLGKSTLVNTLFASHLIDSKGRHDVEEINRQTTNIESVSHVIEENGVKLRLNIVDTPGYGDQVNNEDCWEPIIKLKAIDVIVLKRLVEITNVIPVIAKSDSLTIEERAAFKQRINTELAFHGIQLYPYDDKEYYDEEEQILNTSVRELLPFAVVGSERQVVVDGKAVLGRKTKWGTVVVEDEEHCEFIHLRNFLTRTHLQDLIETTSLYHYESFRANQLLAIKESVSAAATPAPSSPVSSSSNSSNGPIPAKAFPPFA
ncbi:hypothetical protein G6F57_008708 [Rhizopus arrhizus]|uniref:Septin-type G domain-containing protein n=1 Tax=Rhizopus oryzae TaxID=64495 RepID=A0A9P7BQQ8_RHIOR|nr:hypothetical protein G6F23_004547 [Rhizopus arrhizus]KAG1403077.1 hypothetical protein G6F58_010439 [Rhizopus delemar]KAG0763065.1 hypothetical protein G6F24_006314 [Rhizopus arrhizus]KAG0789710.1 hypothetical protein G6F21_006329 [Rhizopus arrhizus]KAG0801420.1 hypothetical protein G6F22_001268 [Rhizopus arrhizus]